MNIQTSDPKGVADVLERAADLLEPDGNWTRVTGARDVGGKIVKPCSPSAVSWCLEGALAAVTRHDWCSSAFEAEPAYKFLRSFLGIDPWEWNDRAYRTQSEVVAKLLEAAALSRAHQEGGL